MRVLAGRFQRLATSPEVIVDVAHNPAAARVLAAQLERLPGEKIAVFAALADKDIAGIVRPLSGIFRRWFAQAWMCRAALQRWSWSSGCAGCLSAAVRKR